MHSLESCNEELLFDDDAQIDSSVMGIDILDIIDIVRLSLHMELSGDILERDRSILYTLARYGDRGLHGLYEAIDAIFLAYQLDMQGEWLCADEIRPSIRGDLLLELELLDAPHGEGEEGGSVYGKE